MTFSISIDFANWVQHQSSVLEKFGGIGKFVPVIKSNGYGLGQGNLVRTATLHGIERIAVGTIFEVDSIEADFAGEVVVLEPIDPRDETSWQRWEQYRHSAERPQLIQTVTDMAALQALVEIQSRIPVLLEVRTSMNRFGFYPTDLHDAYTKASAELDLRGFTAHFPPNTPLALALNDLQALPETETVLDLAVSHLSAADFKLLASQLSNFKLWIRVGTEFWLGNRNLLQAAGKVLAIHDTVGSIPVGYNQKSTKLPFAVVSGGTAHGVSLAAPRAAATLRQRAAAVFEGLLEAFGRSRSPFSLNGKKLWFVEPPHQHVSIVQLPRDHQLKVGMELPAEVRFTISHADEVRGFTN